MKLKRNHFKEMYLKNNMRHYYLLFCLTLFFASCSIDDPKIVTIQNATLVDVTAPDTLTFQQTEVFQVSYRNPTTCHSFENFDILGEEPEFTIRTETRFEETFDCEDTPNAIEIAEFEYTVESQEDHVFKFLAGASDSGQLQFITLELPVKIE
ncbi:MAG: hypothetical protein KGY51_00585 [Psychroflexus sp.]|nr:hypothetical protein [Psychroflexus sp.]